MSSSNGNVSGSVKADGAITPTEPVFGSDCGMFVTAYVTRYCKARIPHAYAALDGVNGEAAQDEVRRYLRENYGITPWARHMLRRFIGEV